MYRRLYGTASGTLYKKTPLWGTMQAGVKREESKMKKKFLPAGPGALVLTFAITGCSSTKSATIFDASVPMKRQSIIINESGININTIDGIPVKSSGEVYIPPGNHELVITVKVTRTISYQTWNISGELKFTRDFESEPIYKTQIKFTKNAAEPRSVYGIIFYHI
jgi:hypothetical protein